MLPIDPVEFPPLKFSKETSSQKYRMSANKIGWLRATANKPGVKFDLTIKDALGRVKIQRLGCDSGRASEFGELLNLPGQLGEEIEVCIENVQDGEELQVFLN